MDFNYTTGDVDYFELPAWGEYDDAASTMNSVSRAMNSIEITGSLCTEYCRTFISCGECTADPKCAWDAAATDGAPGAGGLCISSLEMDVILATEPTRPHTAAGDCCVECTDPNQFGAGFMSCVGRRGCGWCHGGVVYYDVGPFPVDGTQGNCISGTPEAPCTGCTDGEEAVSYTHLTLPTILLV